MAKKSIISTIKDYLYKLQENGILIESAYLYGSYARNEDTEESDIDLLIITDSNDDSDTLSGKVWNLTRNVDTRIEPYVVAKDTFYQSNNPFFDVIRQEGILIL